MELLAKIEDFNWTYVCNMIFDINMYFRAVRAFLSSTESYCSKAS